MLHSLDIEYFGQNQANWTDSAAPDKEVMLHFQCFMHCITKLLLRVGLICAVQMHQSLIYKT